MDFCHISPTSTLNLVDAKPAHLVLAHLIDEERKLKTNLLNEPFRSYSVKDEVTPYIHFYKQQKEKFNSVIIMDNSAFENFKQNKPMFSSEKLVDVARCIPADYIVMSDYPGEHSDQTIEAAEKLAPIFHKHKFGTFFVPQGTENDVNDCLRGFKWAAAHPDLVDYIGVSILTAPIAFGVEKGNKLQRFVSRLRLMYILEEEGLLAKYKSNGQKVHFLGMTDGPNEIMYMHPFKGYIDTWDSSAAIWAGLNNIEFDNSPTGLIDGKFEEEVQFNRDFSQQGDHLIRLQKAKKNLEYIDKLCKIYLS